MKIQKKYGWQERIPAGMFSFFCVFGYSFAKTDSWDLVFGSWQAFCLSMAVMVALYLIFERAIHALYGWLEQRETVSKDSLFQNRFLSWILDEHPIAGTILVLFVTWLPYVIAQYPAAMGHDAYSQLNQALGYSDMVDHHPPFHTYWIEICMKIGRKLASNNVGIFLYIITQLVLIIGILAYFMYWLRQKRVKKQVRLVILAFFAFFPLFPMYATTVLKDVPYAFLFLLYVVLLLQVIECGHKKDTRMWIYLIALSICSLLLMLLRKNGVYVVLPEGLLLLWMGRHAWKKHRKMFLLCAILLLLPVGIYKGYEDWFLPRMGVEPGSIKEMLSIPFQQTARYARDYDEEVTEVEKEAINRVIDYDYLAKLYNPNLSDPIKDMYHGSGQEDLKAYFQVWWHQFLRHPDVYVQATMNNVYGLFYPGVDNTVIFFDLLLEYGYNNFEQPECLAEYRSNLADFTEGALKFPGLNLLNNMALWVWVFILEFFYYCRQKKVTELCVSVPMIISVLVCIASPVILGHPRYVFPIMLGTIVLAGYMTAGVSVRGEGDNKTNPKL